MIAYTRIPTIVILLSAVFLAGRFASAQSGQSPPLASESVPDVLQWSASAFAGAPPLAPRPRRAVELALRRQDYGQLGIDKSVIGSTPLKIGGRSFEHGLGTHANSEIVVSFPPGSVRALKAFVGVDNNSDTRGEFGSVEFSVEAAGQSLFHSRTLRGGEEPLPVEVVVAAEALTRSS